MGRQTRDRAHRRQPEGSNYPADGHDLHVLERRPRTRGAEDQQARGRASVAGRRCRIPPFENFTRFAKMGVDHYCFSGGKGFRGPQCSGILLGRQDLITAALANTCPWEGSVCRAMKVGEEEIMGILAGVDYWAQADLKALNKEWTSRVECIAKLVGTVPGVTTDIAIPAAGNSYRAYDFQAHRSCRE
jgi:hypothetical protein